MLTSVAVVPEAVTVVDTPRLATNAQAGIGEVRMSRVSGRELGMQSSISRRDFMNGLSLAFAARLSRCDVSPWPRTLQVLWSASFSQLFEQRPVAGLGFPNARRQCGQLPLPFLHNCFSRLEEFEVAVGVHGLAQ